MLILIIHRKCRVINKIIMAPIVKKNYKIEYSGIIKHSIHLDNFNTSRKLSGNQEFLLGTGLTHNEIKYSLVRGEKWPGAHSRNDIIKALDKIEQA